MRSSGRSARAGPSVSDADFTELDITAPIRIEVTVGDVPESLLTDNTYLHHSRYYCASGLHDEPVHDEDRYVLTVRLTIDDSLEPQWHVVCGDRLEPKTISNRSRAALGARRLGGEPDRDLRWSRGSSLERLTEKVGDASSALAGAYRAARRGVAAADLQALDGAVHIARKVTPAFGAGIDADSLVAGVDASAFTPNLGALALHEAEVPLTGAGLGTRRLAVLALQAASVPAGAIVLVDEVEVGLEPHRLRHLLRLLRARVQGDVTDDGPAPAQVVMTTHSPIAVVELRATELAVARRTDAREVLLRRPTDELQAVVRSQPEAMLATSVIVGEGPTEQGILRGLDGAWSEHGSPPLAHRGVAVVSGGGCTKAPKEAIELADLGYRVAILVDSDQPIVPGVAEVEQHGVYVAQWAGGMCTEQRLAADLRLPMLVGVLELLAAEVVTPGQVRGDVAAILARPPNDLPAELANWPDEVSENEFRASAGLAMARGKWMKQIGIAEQVGRLIGPALSGVEGTNLAETIAGLRQWSDGA
jgi:putative ATP-dependent endonuclease of OLD family